MISACASARAFVQSLLENRAAQGFDGPIPTTAEVIFDSRYASFATVVGLTCVDCPISSPMFAKNKFVVLLFFVVLLIFAVLLYFCSPPLFL